MVPQDEKNKKKDTETQGQQQHSEKSLCTDHINSHHLGSFSNGMNCQKAAENMGTLVCNSEEDV